MKIVECHEPEVWDRFVTDHPDGGPFHLFGWKKVFQQVYGLPVFYLMALDDSRPSASTDRRHVTARGICPLVFLRSPGGRRRLISLPYLDVGGILADDAACERLLLRKALDVARTNDARWIELRQAVPLACPHAPSSEKTKSCDPVDAMVRFHQVSSHKASLRRQLPTDSRQLMQTFKSKLRSQIHKAIKNGLTRMVGGPELLPAFYDVFSRNMRDLGSPVHSRKLFAQVMQTFGDGARIALVRCGARAVAAAVMLRFKHRMHNPWASSLRTYRKPGANMLLYWAMLEHACEAGLTTFDFGRSSPGAGTFVFKRQWGAEPAPLHWHYLTLRGAPVDPLAEHLSFRAWKRLPVGISRLIGPSLRRHIGL